MAQLSAACAVRTAKQELRKALRSVLAAMTDQQRREESEVLVRKLLASEEYQSSKRVSVYLSMPTEVDTEPVLKDIFSSGRLCFVPCYEGPNMDMLRVHSLEDCNALPKTKWNIRQPDTGEGREEALSSGGLDLIIVPGLGFTKEGNRLGQGKGYYDSYIAKCVQAGFRPKTVALVFSTQLCERVPMTERDMLVDKIFLPYE